MRRVERVVASRGRALTCAVLRAHKCSLFFGHFPPSPRGGSGCFFTAAARKKGVKHRLSVHLTKKAVRRRDFHGGSVQDCGKVVQKRSLFARRNASFEHIVRTQYLKLSANCASAAAVALPSSAYRCDSGANAARPPDRFRSPHPDGRRLLPTVGALPTPFCAPRPTVRPFPTGRGYRSAPRATSSPLPPRKAANGVLPFRPFAAPILYIYAREGAFRLLGGWGTVRPAVGKRKGGKKRTGRWTFSPHCGKDGGKQIVDKWKSARFIHRPATNRGEAVDTARAAGRPTAKALRLPTKKGRSEPETSERKAQKQLRPSHDNDERREPTGTDH